MDEVSHFYNNDKNHSVMCHFNIPASLPADAINAENDLIYIKRRCGNVLLYQGYQYTLKRKNKKGSAVWRCSEVKKIKCNGRMTIKVR